VLLSINVGENNQSYEISEMFFKNFWENIGAAEFSKEMPKEVLIKYIRHCIVLNDVCAFKGNQQ